MIITEETTIETTEMIELEESETEILIIEPENKGISYLLTMVCCHNVINALQPIFAPPTCAYEVRNANARLSNPLVLAVNLYTLAPTIDISVTKTP